MSWSWPSPTTRHDKWVLLSDGNYIWGGLLKGNEVGNVSTPCF
ncbi:hypothetical protein QNO09_30545 [Streptomyces sp. 378]|nr:hypothetical protein [Streptomyces sp. 378]MDK1347563.1 hypothetical protein [Streptomyces sp. 378]